MRSPAGSGCRAAAARGTTASRARPCSRRATTPSSAGCAGRHGAEYARPINSRRCKDLGRIWIGEVNSCASNPNRARYVVPNAPQCRGAGKVYVNHGEEEGRYDECLSPGRVAKLSRIAKRNKQSLNEAALDRNRFNCSYRAGWVMQNGTCVKREGPVPASQQGGFYVVGDSVSWRADDELAARQRKWIIDLRPGRRLDELPGRLDWFRANHADPDQVIIQLGTNRRKGFNEGDFRDTMMSLPASTPVLFLLPYRKFKGDQRGPGRGHQEVRAMDAAPGRPPPADLPVGLAEGRRLPPLLPGRRRAPRRPARGLVRALRRPRLARLRPSSRPLTVTSGCGL